MTWSWSHTPEAYEGFRSQLHVQERDWLIEVYSEWKAKPFPGHFHPKSHSISTVDFDEARAERAKASVHDLSNDALADRIYDLAERQALCTNGGWKGWSCPYGCDIHMLPFNHAEEREDE